MAITEVMLLASWFLLYIILKRVNSYFGSALVLFTFIFAFIVSSQSFSSFYLLLYLVVIVLDLAISQIYTTTNVSPQGNKARGGYGLIALSLVAGIVMYFIISLLGRQVGGNIIGVPNLAVVTPSTIALNFKPVFEASLGIIENSVAFVIYDIMLALGVLIPFVGLVIELSGIIIPMLVASIVLAIFHVVAYSVAFALLLYAGLAFAMFIISRIILKDSLSADLAHYLNNGIISLSRSLQVVV